MAYVPVRNGGGGVNLFSCVQNQHTFSLGHYMKLTLHSTYRCSRHETPCISPACVNSVVMHDHLQSARYCKYLKLKVADRRKCH